MTVVSISKVSYYQDMSWIKKVLHLLDELFFPKICEGCGKVESYICGDCRNKKIEYVESQACHVCKQGVEKGNMLHKDCKSRTNLDGVFIVAKYSKFIEDYIGDIKYEYYFDLIGDLVEIMYEKLKSRVAFHEVLVDAVPTFVPLNGWRKRSRGFNQSELLAVKLFSRFGCKVLKLLKRVRNTKKQVGLNRMQRLKNLEKAFRVDTKHVTPSAKKVIVVDDVMTTGATLEECAKELKENGVEEVYGLVFGRG